MTAAIDQAFLSLCLWKEARGEGVAGMTAVGSVIRNRSHRDAESYYAEVVKRLQFSSITAPGDPELTLYPSEDPHNPLNQMWPEAQQIAARIIAGEIEDATGGATLYYAPGSIQSDKHIEIHGQMVPFPHPWNAAAVVFQAQLGRHLFFSERTA